MKIESIHVTHFLGIEAADLRTRAPVQLMCGPNAAGKSSLRDAVALALTGDLGRVSLKKDAPALIRDGSDLAVCEVKDIDGDEHRVTINRSGKVLGGPKEPSPEVQFAIDGQRFSLLGASERRAFLFSLMNMKLGHTEIAQRLKAKGCDEEKVARILPLLRSGFEPASKDAKDKATQAKGAWRAVTGETYGSEKVKTWRATTPTFDAAALRALNVELEHVDVAIGKWQETIGRAEAVEQRMREQRARLPALHEAAGKSARIGDKLAADEQVLAQAEAALTKEKAAAGGAPRAGLVHELAWSVSNLIAFGDPLDPDEPTDARILAALQAYEAEHGKVIDSVNGGDPDARARLPELQRAFEVATNAVANDRRDLAAAHKAADDARAITAELEGAPEVDAPELEEARAQVVDLKTKRSQTEAKRDALRAAKIAVDAAKDKTEQAAKHAADVAAWDAIGDALAPGGIPADLLASALGPINQRLAQSALDADWPEAQISDSMEILTGPTGRPYRLLSESERWRVDAMLAEAIAQQSGSRLLVLDRFDVLDMKGRSDLLAWLATLVDVEELDTALIFGTLKAPPTGLGDVCDVHWLEAGVVGQLREAA
jgi:hypothetical protein